MELKGKAVQVTDVEWTKVMMEVVVEEGVVNREVVGLSVGRLGYSLRTVTSALRALAGGSNGCLWVREESLFSRRMYV